MAVISTPGCGINKSRLATEQLVVSEAVDKAVATIDFSPLSGRRVFFDTQFLDGVNMGPNGNVKYRHQLPPPADDCLRHAAAGKGRDG